MNWTENQDHSWTLTMTPSEDLLVQRIGIPSFVNLLTTALERVDSDHLEEDRDQWAQPLRHLNLEQRRKVKEFLQSVTGTSVLSIAEQRPDYLVTFANAQQYVFNRITAAVFWRQIQAWLTQRINSAREGQKEQIYSKYERLSPASKAIVDAELDRV